jgi:hypothetical protein
MRNEHGDRALASATGPASALSGAREMLARLAQLNHQLRDELSKPLRIGVGIHYGEAIVGAMEPPRSQIITGPPSCRALNKPSLSPMRTVGTLNAPPRSPSILPTNSWSLFSSSCAMFGLPWQIAPEG